MTLGNPLGRFGLFTERSSQLGSELALASSAAALSAASLAKRSARSFATCAAFSWRSFSLSFRTCLSFFWVALNCSSALDLADFLADFHISRILFCGTKRFRRASPSGSANRSATGRRVKSVGVGRIAPPCSHLMYCRYQQEADGRIHPFSAAQRATLSAAAPKTRGGRPQRQSEAAQGVVSRPGSDSRQKFCRSVRAEAHRRPSALR